MKGFIAFVTGLAAVAGVLFVVAPARLKGYTRRVPDLEPHSTSTPQTLHGSSAEQGSGVPSWRRHDREADRAYLAGDFETAATAWTAAAEAATPSTAGTLRRRAKRARVYGVLAAGLDFGTMKPGPDDEKAYAERISSIKDGGAGEWLDAAAFAASRNLRHHLPWLFERAWDKRTDGTGELDKRLAASYREKRISAGAPAPEVAEAILSELPVGEAATLAREDTGGIGGSRTHVVDDDISSSEGLARARELEKKADAEYRAAVPGSKDVNKHRRAALDLYTEARTIFEEADRESGRGAFGSKIRELNRNIAELRKDLPVGK